MPLEGSIWRPQADGNGPWWTDYQGRELDFIREVLGLVYPGTDILKAWSFQTYLVEALFRYRYVAVRGCRSSSKSHAGGWLVIPTFLCTAPSQILILAPTVEQAKRVTFSKTTAAYRTSKLNLPGRVKRESWEIDEEHFATIIAAKNADNVRGYHGGTLVPIDPGLDAETAKMLRGIQDQLLDDPRRLLIYVDEPQGIGPDTFRVLEGMMSKPSVYCLMQGNPILGIDDDHYFVRACHPESRFHTIKLSALTEQQVAERGGEADPLPADKVFDRIPEEILDPDWVEEQLRFYELTDPFVLSDVLGRFAMGSTSDIVIPRVALETGLNLWKDRGRKPEREIGPRVGVDIGISGDRCVFGLTMHGVVHAEHEYLPGGEDKQAQVSIAHEIARVVTSWGKEMQRMYPGSWDGSPIVGTRLSIDVTGLVGVADILDTLGIECDRVHFGARADEQWKDLVGYDQEFLNVRAEMHWAARRGLQEGVFVVPRKFRRIWQQSQWVHFKRDVASKTGLPVIKLEPKDDVKAAHGRSPDNLDAFVLACRETAPARIVGTLDRRFDPTARPVAKRKNRPGRGWVRLSG